MNSHRANESNDATQAGSSRTAGPSHGVPMLSKLDDGNLEDEGHDSKEASNDDDDNDDDEEGDEDEDDGDDNNDNNDDDNNDDDDDDDDYSAPPPPDERQLAFDRADSVLSIEQKHFSGVSRTSQVPKAIGGTQIRATIAPPVHHIEDLEDFRPDVPRRDHTKPFLDVAGALHLMNMECKRLHKDVTAQSIGFTTISDKHRKSVKDPIVMGVITDFDEYDEDEIRIFEMDKQEEAARRTTT